MDTNELLRKVRKIEIKTKGLSQNIFAGEYHSAFKGRGMTFSEVREYGPVAEHICRRVPLGLQGQGYDLQRGARVPVW